VVSNEGATGGCNFGELQRWSEVAAAERGWCGRERENGIRVKVLVV